MAPREPTPALYLAVVVDRDGDPCGVELDFVGRAELQAAGVLAAPDPRDVAAALRSVAGSLERAWLALHN